MNTLKIIPLICVLALAVGPALAAAPDGEGKAEFKFKKKPVVNEPWRGDLVFTVGPSGMASGAGIRFLTPPQSWGAPKDSLKYLKIESGSKVQPRIAIEDRGVLGWIVRITFTGGSLEQGDRIIYTYDPEFVQKYSQLGLVCQVQSDADGDGRFSYLSESPKLDVLNRPAAHLRIVTQQIVKPGQEMRVRSIVLDDLNNPVDKSYKNKIRIGMSGQETERRFSVNKAEFTVQAPDKPGIYHIHGTGKGLKDAYLPICVTDDTALNIYWGQLHGHTNTSDGVDTTLEYYAYGRHIGMLDVCAANDHAESINRNNAWPMTVAMARDFYKPGEFVTLAGYEWTTEGHRNVYFAETTDDLPLCGFDMEGSKTYPEMIAKLKTSGKEVIIGYHTAHPTDLNNYDPQLHHLEELHSMWGTSEYPMNPGWTKLKDGFLPFSSAQAALAKGQRFGFVAGGDSHHGRPGRFWFGSRWGLFGHKEGAAAILAPKLERRDVFDALKNHHTYATTGERILALMTIDGHQMGDEFVTSGPVKIKVEVGATGPLDKIEIVRDNQNLWGKNVEGMTFTEEITDDTLTPGLHWYYLRVTQKDYDRAWTTPIWVTRKE